MMSNTLEGFDEAWTKSTPFIEKALKENGAEFTVEDVLREVQDEQAIFYPVTNGAAIFTVAQYPQRRLLRIWLYGGKTDTGRANLDVIMQAADYFAEKHECDGVELTGRKGWEKVLHPYGYKYKSVTLSKDLGEHGNG